MIARQRQSKSSVSRRPRRALDGLRVQVVWKGKHDRPECVLLHRVTRLAAQKAGFLTGLVQISVVGARSMAALHGRALGEARVTDVLTFDLGSDARAGVLDGEIVVCLDAAREVVASRPAADVRALAPGRRAGNSPSGAARLVAYELSLYVVHGLLHLAGWSDARAADFRRMHAREDEILMSCKLPPMYSLFADDSRFRRRLSEQRAPR